MQCIGVVISELLFVSVSALILDTGRKEGYVYTACVPFNTACQCPSWEDGCFKCPCSQAASTTLGTRSTASTVTPTTTTTNQTTHKSTTTISATPTTSVTATHLTPITTRPISNTTRLALTITSHNFTTSHPPITTTRPTFPTTRPKYTTPHQRSFSTLTTTHSKIYTTRPILTTTHQTFTTKRPLFTTARPTYTTLRSTFTTTRGTSRVTQPHTTQENTITSHSSSNRKTSPTECAVCSGPVQICESVYAIQTCTSPNNYCVNRVTNFASGARIVNRTCGDANTCEVEWYLGTSDNDKCGTFGSIYTFDFNCTFCCVDDNCNIPIRPKKTSLYTP